MSLELNPEVERMVRERAAADGVSVDDLLMYAFAGGGEAKSAEERVRALLAQWQARDCVQTVPLTRDPDGATFNETLFERWRELDTAMTEAEREAEDQLWEDVERGIEETRAQLGMRPLSR